MKKSEVKSVFVVSKMSLSKPGTSKENLQNSCTQAAATCARKGRTFFSLQMDIHLIRLCVEHNPYQLGKGQWAFILDDMNTTFNLHFLLRTLKERSNKLVEKYKAEQLQYKTGTEEEHSELGYIDASAAPISHQVNADSPSEGEEEENNALATSQATPRIPATTRKEKQTADREREQLLNQIDMAPEPVTLRRKRTAILPEDELIRRKQEQYHEIELKRIRLEERKMEMEHERQRQQIDLEREKIELEKEKLRISEQENKQRNLQQQQMHDLFMILAKK